ncbi:MAG TPA: DNA methyltransferase [Candidatus Obscuribacterales bacterium]
MKTFISLKNEKKRILPEQFRHDDVRYCDALVEHFLQEFTQSGDKVLDPFMGYGTTVVVAEQMARSGFGVEYDEARCRYVQSLLRHPERAIHGDSTRLLELDLPDLFDFSITSPPYMGKHHKENPFTAYTTEFSGYDEYLEQIKGIYAQIAKKLKPEARAVVEVANLKHEDGSLTTLAWDIGEVISKVLKFEGEVIVTWEDGYGYGYDHSYCLMFNSGRTTP